MEVRPSAAGTGAETSRYARAGIGPALAFVAIALLAWLPSIVGAGFSFDDREAVEGNPVVEGSLPWTAAFQQDYWEHRGAAGHFRPLASLTLRFDRALWSDHGAGFHATNVVLHALVVLLAALFLQRFTPRGERWPWIGLALFAAHPVLADSVAWISGRSSMLSALFGLGAAILLSGTSSGRSARELAGCFGLGLIGTGLSSLGKEDGALWALALPCIAARRGTRAFAATAAGCGAGVALMLLLRTHALGSPWIHAPNAPLAKAALADRLLVGGRALLEALRLVAWPARYPPGYSGDPTFSASALHAAPLLGLCGLGFWLAALLVAGWAAIQRRTLLTIASLLALLAWIPFLEIVPAGEIFAPRFLYLPLLFSIPLLHAVLATGFGRRATLLAALLVACAVAASWYRGRVYSNRGSYRMAILERRPDDVASWNDLGLFYEEKHRPLAAREAWTRATELDPEYSRAWSNLGRMALDEGDAARAVDHLEHAVQVGAKNAVAWVDLGRARFSTGEFARAEQAYRRATSLAPGLARGWEGLARALIAQGRGEEARSAIDRLLELEPDNPRAKTLPARRRASPGD